MLSIIALIVAIIVWKQVSQLERRVSAMERLRTDKSVAPVAHDDNVSHDIQPQLLLSEHVADITVADTQSAGERASQEVALGGRLFTIIGIIALLLGVSFFLRYAFDHDIISEMGRVIIGLVFGSLLVVSGRFLANKVYTYGYLLAGAGLAILYMTFFAAHGFYNLLTTQGAMAGIVAVVILGIYLSIRSRVLGLALVSFGGAFVAPFILTFTTDPIILYSFLLAVHIGVLVVMWFMRWPILGLLAYIVSAFVSASDIFVLGSTQMYLGGVQPQFVELVYSTILMVAYLAYGLSSYHVRGDSEIPQRLDSLLFVLVPTLYFLAEYPVVVELYGESSRLMPLVLAIAYGGGACAVRILGSSHRYTHTVSTLMFVIATPLIATAIALYVDGDWITVLWALEAMTLILLGLYSRMYILRLVGIVLMALVYLRFLIEMDTMVTMPFFNTRMFVALLVCVATWYVGYTYRRMLSVTDVRTISLIERPLTRSEQSNVITMAILGINILLLFVVSLDVSNYFDHIRSTGTQSYESISNTERVIMSLVWLLYACGLAVYGVVRSLSLVRKLSIGLFLIVVCKVFIYDTQALSDVYRFVSFISLGVILLLVGYVYYRYRDKIMTFINVQKHG